MLKLTIVLSSVMAYCMASAGGYGGSSGGASYGGSGGGGYSGGASVGGYSGGSGGAVQSGGGHSGGIIQAAIHTRHQIDFKDVPSSGAVNPATIEVGSSSVPLNILFRSSSSNLNVQQDHQGGGGDTQRSQSEDEPHRLIHEVSKPIIQEVREVITPFRKIVQEIQPVQEEIQTIVARGQQQRELNSQTVNRNINTNTNNFAAIGGSIAGGVVGGGRVIGGVGGSVGGGYGGGQTKKAY
ncbi:keratin, type II cytoskeletal 1-like [Oppia nitens]|uniref:keratin, type II cytoskeletal 1-like n=1 Tax=Oppia nitens TaxID=1686743 RepID=UPI0023DA30F8|nr:keratin, type II cytoskeletal 1-like [Oppia nitens]